MTSVEIFNETRSIPDFGLWSLHKGVGVQIICDYKGGNLPIGVSVVFLFIMFQILYLVDSFPFRFS